MADAPVDIKYLRDQRVLQITWTPDDITRLPARNLRCQCPCAECVHEFTGERLLDQRGVAGDIAIAQMQLAGRYAVQFTFSDGHDTGIYTWKRLREIAAR